jgi:hypothetical protein
MGAGDEQERWGVSTSAEDGGRLYIQLGRGPPNIIESCSWLWSFLWRPSPPPLAPHLPSSLPKSQVKFPCPVIYSYEAGNYFIESDSLRKEDSMLRTQEPITRTCQHCYSTGFFAQFPGRVVWCSILSISISSAVQTWTVIRVTDMVYSYKVDR